MGVQPSKLSFRSMRVAHPQFQYSQAVLSELIIPAHLLPPYLSAHISYPNFSFVQLTSFTSPSVKALKKRVLAKTQGDVKNLYISPPFIYSLCSCAYYAADTLH